MILSGPRLTRRNFIVAGSAATAALVIGFKMWPKFRGRWDAVASPIDAWLRIDADGTATLLSAKAEMGQGVMTSLPMILAEELDLDFSKVRVEQAPTNPALYQHGTGGSASVRTQWLALRRAGAAARQMLVSAAAARWSVPAAECRTAAGAVVHDRSNRKAGYADLVADAAKLPLPDLEQVPLKNPARFTIVGHSVPRVDIPSKVDGSARFGLDVRLPGMLYAVVSRCPVFGGKPKGFDATKAKAIPGVRQVFEIPAVPRAKTAGGVAVVAETTYAAIRGANELSVDWDLGPDASEGTDALRERMRKALSSEQKAYRNDGDAALALSKATRLLEAEYELPFLAHATMEPPNTTAHATAGGFVIHSPTQGGNWTRDTVSEALAIPPERVVVHTTLLGGGFGRRLIADTAVEAVQVSQKAGSPVMLVWTREDDLRHDFYRPAALHHLKAALDEGGRPTAWWHRMTSTSINRWFDPDGDPGESEVGGAENLPYAIPNLRFEYGDTRSSVPRAWWRSVEHSINAFVTESFLDELAAAAKADPAVFRLSLLAGDRRIAAALDKDTVIDTRRLRATLQLAAEKSGWGTPLPEGRGRGVSSHFSFESYVTQVAEVSVSEGRVRVHRVVCAVDCGRVVHPDGVAAQVEGGIAFGLSALKNEITLADGRVRQTNFGDYEPLRIHEMPEVEVHIVQSDEPPTGMGEPAVPPIAAAVTNAVFALTGKRLRRLPIGPQDLTSY